MEKFECREGCGACCIAPSISSALPGMPNGKPAGVRCVNLSGEDTCTLWGSALFPEVCQKFRPEPSVCGTTSAEALALLTRLENQTRPSVFASAAKQSIQRAERLGSSVLP